MRKHLFPLIPFVVLLLAWQAAVASGRWSTYILPPPQQVLTTAQRMLTSGELWKHTLISLRRVLWGFMWAFGLAAFFSFASLLVPVLKKLDKGLFSVLQHIPPLSLIPLLILWFGIGETPKTIIIVLATFFPIYLNMEESIRRCDPKLLELGKMLGMTRMEQLWKIRVPSALPYILTGIKVGMGYSLRAIIGAEMIAADSGLGYLILDAQTMSRSDKVIIGILAIGALGFLIDGLFAFLTWYLLPYERRRG
jgi:sulfonate transport system permease protein